MISHLKINKNLSILYCLSLIILFSIKYFYSKSTSNELDWILKPTSRWVQILSGISFKKVLDLGYINRDYKFIIAPSCSGVTFMLITFSTLVFSFVKQMKTLKHGFFWLTISLFFFIYIHNFYKWI